MCSRFRAPFFEEAKKNKAHFDPCTEPESRCCDNEKRTEKKLTTLTRCGLFPLVFSAEQKAEKKFYLDFYFFIIFSVISTRPHPYCFKTLICAAHCITSDVGAAE